MDNDFISMTPRASSARPDHLPRPLITPSASPPINRSFTCTPVTSPSLSGKRRPSSLNPSLSVSAFDANTFAEIDAARRASSMKVLEIWSQLAQKYTRRLDEDDIINLRDETIIKDRGVLRNSGSLTYQIGSFADSHHENNSSPLQEDEDFDEIDAFYSPRDYSPSELEENVMGSDSELKRQFKRISPVRERDPEDAEDLKDFLEAESLRREFFCEPDTGDIIDVDDLDSGELIEDSFDKDNEEQSTANELDLFDTTLLMTSYPSLTNSSSQKAHTDSIDDLPFQSCHPSTEHSLEEIEVSDEDEFGAWTHDEASMINEPSEISTFNIRSASTTPSTSDHTTTMHGNKLTFSNKLRRRSKNPSRINLPISTGSQRILVTNDPSDLTPTSRRINKKFEEIDINSKKSSRFICEQLEPAIPYQSPPWSSPSIQDTDSVNKISLLDLTNEIPDDVGLIENGEDVFNEDNITTINRAQIKNSYSQPAKTLVSSHEASSRRGASLKPEVVIVQHSWSRRPANKHTRDSERNVCQASYNLSLANNNENCAIVQGSDVGYSLSSASPTPPLPKLRHSKIFHKETISASRKRRRPPSPELYDMTEYNDQDPSFPAGISRSANFTNSRSPNWRSSKPKPSELHLNSFQFVFLKPIKTTLSTRRYRIATYYLILCLINLPLLLMQLLHH